MAKTTSKKSAVKSSSSNNNSKGTNKSAPKKAAAKSASPKAASPKAASPKKAAPKKAAASRNNTPANARNTASKQRPSVNETGMLEELFMDSLKDIYWAEKHLLKALPKLRRAATSQDLQQAFETHLAQTQNQVQRLEQVFEILGKKAQAKKCEAMAGLSKEADEIVTSTPKGSMTRDVGLIIAAQKVEHYEIATYGSLATLAAVMGNNQVKELLGETLQEEKDTDELLTGIAEGHVNQQAAQNESEDGSGEEEEE
jgi:ferritin-like metal-binding protein YciE